MRVPQVSERIKEAPAQALRGVFAGIGQLLLITDKIRHKTPADQDVPRARAPEAAETITDTPVTSPAGSTGETSAAAPAEPVTAEPVTAEPTAAAVTAEPAAAAEPVTEPAEATPAEASPAAAAPVEAAPVEAAPVEAALAGEAAPAKPAARRTAAKPATAKPAAAKRSPATSAAAKPATTRRAAKPAADAAAAEVPKPPKRQSTRNFDKTGNVRVLADQADSPSPSAAAPDAVAVPEPVAAPEPVTAAEPAAVPEPVTAAEPVAAGSGAGPLPNYDALTVASLRARLRNLDITQVRQLAEYERAHAGREDVLGMYERRIAKLEAEA
jgi:hypothetical protein